MNRYKVQLDSADYYVMAEDAHDAAQQGADLATKFDTFLHDVTLDNPEEVTDDLDGDSLLWL